MGQFDALKPNSVESKQTARPCDPHITIIGLRQSDDTTHRRALAGAPCRVVQLLDIQIGIKRIYAAAPDERSDRKPTACLTANEPLCIHVGCLRACPILPQS